MLLFCPNSLNGMFVKLVIVTVFCFNWNEMQCKRFKDIYFVEESDFHGSKLQKYMRVNALETMKHK